MKKKTFDPFKNLKLDAYEQEIEDAIERGEYKPVKNQKEFIRQLRQAAANTLKKNKNINIRINEQTLETFKKQAAREGLPYQTLAASVLHKYAHGMLKPA